MLRQLLPICVCALLAAVPAAADTFNDILDAGWEVEGTWDVSGYPGAGDTAILDSNEVTAGVVIDPGVAVDIQTGGTLHYTDGAAAGTRRVEQTVPLTLSGGTLKAYKYDTVIAQTGTVTVEAASTVQAKEGYRAGFEFGSFVDGTTTGAVTIESFGGVVDVYLNGSNLGFSGGFIIRAPGEIHSDPYYGSIRANVAGALGTGSILVENGASLVLNAPEATTGQGPAEIVVKANSEVYVEGQRSGYTNEGLVDWDNDPVLKLDGGQLRLGRMGNGCDWAEAIEVVSDSILATGCNDNYSHCYVSGPISGSAKLSVQSWHYGNEPIRLRGDNSGFTGEIVLDAPNSQAGSTVGLMIAGPDAVGGTGTITVEDSSYLQMDVVPNTAPGKLLVKTGGEYRAGRRHSQYSYTQYDTDWDMELAGGTFYGGCQNATLTHSGDFLITGEGTIEKRQGTLELDGLITGGEVNFICDNAVIVVSGTQNTYSGGTNIVGVGSGYLRATAQGSLGTAAVTLGPNARLDTQPPNPNDPVLGTLPVVVDEGGLLNLNSTEPADASMTVKGGGGLAVSGGSTVFDFGATGNCAVHTGAVLDENLATTPTPGQVVGGGQLYKGVMDASFAGPAYTVGPGGSNAYVGLSTMYNQATLPAGVTVTEDTAGQGFSLRAGPGQTMNFNGATLDATGPVELVGPGTHSINSTLAGTAATYNQRDGQVLANTDGALRDTDTLNVYGGYFQVEASSPGAVGTTTPAGATVNIKNGGAMDLHSTYYSYVWKHPILDRGTFTIEAGGTLAMSDWPGGYNGNATHDTGLFLGGGASWTFQRGANISIVADDDMHTNLPTVGVNYYVENPGTSYRVEKTLGAVGGDDVILMDNGVIVCNNMTYPGSLGGGTIKLEAGGTSARISGNLSRDEYMEIRNKIEFPGQTLVLGGPGTDTVYAGHGVTREVGQDSRIRLTDKTNVIGRIVIDSIIVQVKPVTADGYKPLVLGGADIHFQNGGSLTWDTNVTWESMVLTDQTVSGQGTLTTGWGESLKMEGGGIDPGSPGVPGVVTNDSYSGIYFAASGVGNAALVMDVFTDGGASPPVAGTDHDQLGGNQELNDLPNADLVVNLPVPSVNLNPANLAGDEMTIVTTNSNLSGLVTGVDGFASALINTVDDARNHWTGTVNYYNGSVAVADLAWTGHDGDANLDDVVNVLDLGALANNYKTAGPHDWSTADFNLDGEVNVLDLGLLANSYRWDGTGGGGEPVPEPLTLVVLGLGTAVVLRRRR